MRNKTLHVRLRQETCQSAEVAEIMEKNKIDLLCVKEGEVRAAKLPIAFNAGQLSCEKMRREYLDL